MLTKYIKCVISVVLVFILHAVLADVTSATETEDDKHLCLCNNGYNVQDKLKEVNDNIYESFNTINRRMEHVSGTVDDIFRDVNTFTKNTKQHSDKPAYCNHDNIPIIELLLNMDQQLKSIANENTQRNNQLNRELVAINKRIDDMETVALEAIQTKSDNITDIGNDVPRNIENAENQKQVPSHISKQLPKLNTLQQQNDTVEPIQQINKTVPNEQNVRVVKLNVESSSAASEAPSAARGAVALCDVINNVSSSVQANHSSWRHQERPARDDMDDYIINKTGCRYWAGQMDSLQLRDITFSGTAVEHRVALRTDQQAAFYIFLNHTTSYYINMNIDDRQHTELGDMNKILSDVSSPPDLLSLHKYVPLYVSLDAERLSFGTECDPGLRIEHHISLAAGTQVRMKIMSISQYGGKVLFECPPRRR